MQDFVNKRKTRKVKMGSGSKQQKTQTYAQLKTLGIQFKEKKKTRKWTAS